VEEGEAHDCWTTTEAALTRDLSQDLQDAYARLRETAADFGEQRIYASHNSIMFARRACYFFVRPKRSFLEVCVFLPRTVHAPQVRKATPSSKVKVAHILQIRHRDEVEAPITDWLREAYALEDSPAPVKKSARKRGVVKRKSTASRQQDTKSKVTRAKKAKRAKATPRPKRKSARR
jgi:hypothetical protein